MSAEIPQHSATAEVEGVRLNDLRTILDGATWFPPLWTAFVSFIAVASCFEFERTAGGDLRALLQVEWPTAVIAALIWLPTSLRLLGIVGGRVRKGDVEASTRGLLEQVSEDAVPYLTELRTATDPTLAPSVLRQGATDLSEQIDRIAELLQPRTISSEVIDRLARTYEQLRVDLTPGDPRTIAMTEVVNEARVRASSDRDGASALGLQLVKDSSEGRRMVGLAFLQEEPDRRAFGDVLNRITDSQSAFEAFHALNALKNLAPRLSAADKKVAIDALEREEGDPRGIGVMRDVNLPDLIRRVIRVLRP